MKQHSASAVHILAQLGVAALVALSASWPLPAWQSRPTKPLIAAKMDRQSNAVVASHTNQNDNINLCKAYSVAGVNQTNIAIGQPAISGNGEVVAFWSAANLTLTLTGSNSNADQNVEIFTAKRDGTDLKQISNSSGTVLGGFNLAPSLNTTGTRLVFFSDRSLAEQNSDENFEIFLSDGTNGITAITQTDDRFSSINPVISGNGETIAFVSNADLQPTRNADENDEIFVARKANGGNWSITQVTSDTNTSHDYPSISADGKRLVYVETRREEFGSTLGNASIVKLASEVNGTWQIITVSQNATAINNQARISGDGNHIVYISSTVQGETPVSQLMLVQINGGQNMPPTIGATTPINQSDATPSQPTLSKDGKRVVFVSQSGDTVELALYDQVNKQEYTRISLGAQPQSAVNYGSTNANPVISDDGLAMAWVQGGQVRAFYCPLVVRKQGPSQVIAGKTGVPLTVTVTNLSDSVISTQLSLEDTVSKDLTIESAGGGTIDEQGKSVTWSIDNLDAGTTVPFEVNITASPNTPKGSLELPKAKLYVVENPDSLILESNPLTFLVGISNVLLITKTASKTSVVEEEIFTYTIELTNQGPSQAYNLVVKDELPSQLELVKLPENCASSGQQVTCEIDKLPVRDSEKQGLSLEVKPTSGSAGKVLNTAQVTSTDQQTPATSLVEIDIQKPKIEVSHAVDPAGPVNVGNEFKFSITVKNEGKAEATGTTVESILTALDENKNSQGDVTNFVELKTVKKDGTLITSSNNNGFNYTGNLAAGASWNFELTVKMKNNPPPPLRPRYIRNTVNLTPPPQFVSRSNSTQDMLVHIPVTAVTIQYTSQNNTCPSTGTGIPVQQKTTAMFTSDLEPDDAFPVVYQWTATEQTEQTSPSASFTWSTPGEKTITLTVNNNQTAQCKVTISSPP